ncbi:MAG: NAD(P)H-dependent oxidoreductase [Acidimicrobiales bacterium]
MKPRLQIIVGSTRPTRFADKPLAWLLDRLSKRDDVDIEVLDMRDHPLALFNLALSPARTRRDYPSEEVGRLGQALDAADGYIVLTSEYNHGYPASLKNALDYVFVELNRKPVSFVGYGGVGAARAIEQLRLVCIEFEMAPLRHAVHILPDVLFPAMTAEEFDLEVFAPLDARLEMLLNDLLWWTVALKAARGAG